MRTDENLSNFVRFDKNDNVLYDKVWNKATIYEKAWIVSLAEEKYPGIMGSVVIFVDVWSYPKWDEIDEKYQEQLTETLEEWIP